MMKTILKKEKGNTIESKFVKTNTKGTNLEQSKKTLLTKELPKSFTKEEISGARYFIDTMLDNVTYIYNLIECNKGNIIIENFYQNIKKAKNINDIKKIINLIISEYAKIVPDTSKKENNINNIKKMLLNTPDLIYSMLIKKLVKLHCLKMLNDLDESQINSIQNLKLKGTTIDNILKYIGENFDNQSIENGIANVVNDTFSKLIDKSLFKTSCHLCWENCENAETTKCEKIRDLTKKSINEYDFITDGIQIIDEKGNIDRFIVTGCTNYSLAPEKKFTFEEKQKIRELKIGLKLDYFEAENLYEANNIQKHLIKTHQLFDPKTNNYIKKH